LNLQIFFSSFFQTLVNYLYIDFAVPNKKSNQDSEQEFMKDLREIKALQKQQSEYSSEGFS